MDEEPFLRAYWQGAPSSRPIPLGSLQYEQARDALLAKIEAVTERFHQAKEASDHGDQARTGQLLYANVEEFKYVDRYIEMIENGDDIGVRALLSGQPEVQQYADALENYARFVLSQNRWEDAEPLITKTCRLLEPGNGVDHQPVSAASRPSVSLNKLGKTDDLDVLVETTQNKLAAHRKQVTVSKMQSQLLGWIDTVPQLDRLARKFVAASDVQRRSLLRQAKQKGKKISKIEPGRAVVVDEYLKIMKRIIKKGPVYLDDMRKRLEKIIKGSSNSISEAKTKQLVARLAVARAFQSNRTESSSKGKLNDISKPWIEDETSTTSGISALAATAVSLQLDSGQLAMGLIAIVTVGGFTCFQRRRSTKRAVVRRRPAAYRALKEEAQKAPSGCQ